MIVMKESILTKLGQKEQMNERKMTIMLKKMEMLMMGVMMMVMIIKMWENEQKENSEKKIKKMMEKM
jgi:hypothetical protein